MPKALPKGTPGKTKPVWTIVSSRVSAPILENLTPPLKCTLVQKNKDSFFKGKKKFTSNNEMRTHLKVEI